MRTVQTDSSASARARYARASAASSRTAGGGRVRSAENIGVDEVRSRCMCCRDEQECELPRTVVAIGRERSQQRRAGGKQLDGLLEHIADSVARGR